MLSTTIYRRGDIVLVPFPFTDQSGFKRCPAVVLSTEDYNTRRGDAIIAPITSNLQTGQADDILILDWASARLLKPSAVKGILGTIEQSLIRLRMGSLSPQDLARFDALFTGILHLSPN